MPKVKKRSKGGLHPPAKKDDNRGSVLSDDGESVVDNASVISYTSSAKWDCSDDENGTDESQSTLGPGYLDDFEDKLNDAIEGTGGKSVKTRQMSLEAIKKALTTRYCWEFVMNRKMTIGDILERSIKRKGEELGSAAILLSVVCTTMGSCDETDQLFYDLHSHLSTALADNSVPASVRSKCAMVLGLGCFITSSGLEVLEPTMSQLQSIFAASFLKGNGVMPSHSPEILALHSSALYAWTLLLTILNSNTAMALAEKNIKRLSELLDSPDVDLRIAAGECIAVLNEITRERDEEFEFDDVDELCDKLRQLATDSQKFRGKKERRQQRSSFRDVLRAIENNEPPTVIVKFGRERLVINSWCAKRQYDAFCDVLKSGMNLHLAENQLLRDIFSLGSPLSMDATVKISKFERNMGNIAACKARTKTRGKLRDKRADVIL